MGENKKNVDFLRSIVGAESDLILNFFALFSRFEYALKRCGFCINNKTFAEADWDSFSNKMKGLFSKIEDEEFKSAVSFLESEPPRKQLALKGVLTWGEPIAPGDGETDEKYTLRLVRAVRNNLFHGGKFPGKVAEETARNEKLIKSSMDVLEKCLDLNPELRNVFLEGV